MKTDMHEAWLDLEKIMEKRHGDKWEIYRQGMQCAFYFGAIATLRSEQPKNELWSQCENGLQDGLNIAGVMHLKVND